MTNAVNLASAAGTGFFRNRIINGNFDFWQRGTSFSVGGTTTYHADRWCSIQYAGSTASFTRQSSGLAGSPYCLRAQRPASSTYTATVNVGQFIETANCGDLAGQSVTLSFYARAGSNFSAAANALISDIVTGTGTDQNNYTSTYTNKTDNNQTNTLTTSWQRFTQTITLSASITEIGVQFYYTPSGTAGANDYFEIEMVQLEAGSVATPFERRSYGAELALCQRYYQRYADGTLYGSWGSGSGYSMCSGMFPVVMRAAPSFSITGNSYSYYGGGVSTNSYQFQFSGVGSAAAPSFSLTLTAEL